MPSRLAGLWHVRGGPLATTVLAVALLFTVAFPEMSISVSVVFDLPPRGVGTPEIVAVLLAGVLPAVTVPRFDARELTARLPARLAHLGCTAAVLATPLTVLPVWYWRITASHPGEPFPPLYGLVGNVSAFSCVGVLLCLALGPLAAVVATPALFAGFVVVQHVAPDSILAREFATGRLWHTNGGISAVLAILTLALAWQLRSIPWPDRP